MARTTQLLQIFSLLLLTFILSSRQTQAKPTAVHIGNGDGGGSVDDDGNGDANGNVGGGGGGSSSEESSVETEEDHLLSDLRVSTYLALTRFCQQCSFVIDDLQKPLIRTGSREIEMANSIRDNLLAISKAKYGGEDIPKDRHAVECTNLVQDYLSAALRAETTNNDPTRSNFLPRTSPNVRNVLLHQVADEVRRAQNVYNCIDEFANTEDDDEINIL